MKTQDEIAKLHSQLENWGLEQVEIKLAQGVYGRQNKLLVESWIKNKKDLSVNQHRERNIAIAVEVNQIAKKSNTISVASFVVSVLALIISILVAIFK